MKAKFEDTVGKYIGSFRYKIDMDDDQFTVNPRLINKVEPRLSVLPRGDSDEDEPSVNNKGGKHSKDVSKYYCIYKLVLVCAIRSNLDLRKELGIKWINEWLRRPGNIQFSNPARAVQPNPPITLFC